MSRTLTTFGKSGSAEVAPSPASNCDSHGGARVQVGIYHFEADAD